MGISPWEWFDKAIGREFQIPDSIFQINFR
jgi:hypothetical protein